ncbi:carnitine 3-dehydrogenase, partial [Rhodobacterales bacterium HKCCE3408]|nr:carnitine 3-dehydrogenase [Rhodobacterales bacterium HKCCE3408]
LAASGGDVAACVAAMRALKARRAGLGAAIAAHEATIAPSAPEDLSQPPVTLDRQVPPDWVDYNGHMNEARYLTAFSDATDRLLLWAGMDAACIAEGHSVFTVETHIRHLAEVDIGDRITVRTRVLDGAGKRLHVWHELFRGETLAATGEQLLLHVDLASRRVALPRADVGAWLGGAAEAQADLPVPEGLGRFVGEKRGG